MEREHSTSNITTLTEDSSKKGKKFMIKGKKNIINLNQ